MAIVPLVRGHFRLFRFQRFIKPAPGTDEDHRRVRSPPENLTDLLVSRNFGDQNRRSRWIQKANAVGERFSITGRILINQVDLKGRASIIQRLGDRAHS